jgi:hypothetical protein
MSKLMWVAAASLLALGPGSARLSSPSREAPERTGTLEAKPTSWIADPDTEIARR